MGTYYRIMVCLAFVLICPFQISILFFRGMIPLFPIYLVAYLVHCIHFASRSEYLSSALWV